MARSHLNQRRASAAKSENRKRNSSNKKHWNKSSLCGLLEVVSLVTKIRCYGLPQKHTEAKDCVFIRQVQGNLLESTFSYGIDISEGIVLVVGIS
ncbi:hypothetical protein NDU88_006690 [Pleurodeles waltl]|uniref:Uncharacterized protein n=1 Tax=Pleurodeles waltl TaxID=8319 RepID=A0AAV7X0W8_PLEWA|nr:hypothetical protein NDU88_006690 [Pleurodeles waltl]